MLPISLLFAFHVLSPMDSHVVFLFRSTGGRIALLSCLLWLRCWCLGLGGGAGTGWSCWGRNLCLEYIVWAYCWFLSFVKGLWGDLGFLCWYILRLLRCGPERGAARRSWNRAWPRRASWGQAARWKFELGFDQLIRL